MSSGAVIVSGGTFGLGREISLRLAEAGYPVTAFGLETPQISSIGEWTEHGGHAARFLFATVSRPSRTAALVTATR